MDGRRRFLVAAAGFVLLVVAGSVGADEVALDWSIEYHSPYPYWDEALAVALDGDGNVIVAGNVLREITNEYQYGDIVTVFHDDLLVLKYDPAGNLLWSLSRDGGVGDYKIARLVVDAAGNIVVGGNLGNNMDGIVVGIDPDGTERWARPLSQDDHQSLTALVAAPDGGVIAVGFWTCPVMRLNGAGEIQWSTTYVPTTGETAACSSSAVDSTGNVWAVGTLYYADYADTDFLVLKYDAAGTLLWAATYGGPAEMASEDHALAVGVDGDGNAVVTGGVQTAGPSGSCADMTTAMATVKFDPGGGLLWARLRGGVPRQIPPKDAGMELAINAAGGIVVQGVENGSTITVAYDAAGNELWSDRPDDFGSGGWGCLPWSDFKELAMDGSGRIYRAHIPSDGRSDVESFDSAGGVRWSASVDAVVYAIAVGASGDVAVAGAHDANVFTAKFSQSDDDSGDDAGGSDSGSGKKHPGCGR